MPLRGRHAQNARNRQDKQLHRRFENPFFEAEKPYQRPQPQILIVRRCSKIINRSAERWKIPNC